MSIVSTVFLNALETIVEILLSLKFSIFKFTIFMFKSNLSLKSCKNLHFFGLFSITFVAMGYELVEWIYAVTSDPTAGAAFLGSQGDVWDAQKDMLMDTLGAVAMIRFTCLQEVIRIARS